jgi:UDPglucose--hexose-1-phosphate uridylyltransferase
LCAVPTGDLRVLQRFARLYGDPPPCTSAWHQVPLHLGRVLMGLHLELLSIRRTPGTLNDLAESESAA